MEANEDIIKMYHELKGLMEMGIQSPREEDKNKKHLQDALENFEKYAFYPSKSNSYIQPMMQYKGTWQNDLQAGVKIFAEDVKSMSKL